MSKIPKTDEERAEHDRNANSQLDLSDNAIRSNVSVDQTLFYLLKRLVEEKKDKDEAFADRYANLDYQELVTNLKFYISDYQSLLQNPLASEAEATFQKIPLAPKYGPLSSSSELYTLPGWNDELIELIQNEFSVYPNSQIDFNKITANMLKILVPNINEDEVKLFFEYRDDPEAPKFINSLADFKNYVVSKETLMSSNDFDQRMELFQKRGITFGSNPNLFKVISEGSYNRAVYTLVAYVLLPKQETAAGAATPNLDTNGDGKPDAVDSDGDGKADKPTDDQKQKTQLLEPRIIEIQIN